jgi:predicted DNA-binding transcriptional regulator YafY
MIMLLLEREKISATKLADMFEVTPRTIYRDIETISSAGIPIVTYPGVNGGISIMEEYKIEKKLFTLSDITVLLMGLGSIHSTMSSDEILNTMAKVKGILLQNK